MKPGQIVYASGDIEINAGNEAITIEVINKGDRPAQIGSHHHFFEVNSALHFDRNKGYGKRLDVPSGSSVRFEPGESKKINLVDFKGTREIYGFDEYVEGPIGNKPRNEYVYDKDGKFAFGGSLQHHPNKLPNYDDINNRLAKWAKAKMK